MALLWMGGEDLDFPNGVMPNANTSAPTFRSGYARCSLQQGIQGQFGTTNNFAGGAITSCWLAFQFAFNSNGSTSLMQFGITNGTTQKGLFIGIGTVSSRLALFKYDGSTVTNLVQSIVDRFPGNTIILCRIDIQIINYGATGTVNVYVNNSLEMTFTGNIAVAGITNLNSLSNCGHGGNNGGISEGIVADEDTRTFSLVTLAPSAAGTTDSWSGAFTDVNPVAINDANAVFTNVATQDEQFNLTDLPAGVFFPRGVRIAVRASNTLGATAVKVALGVNSGGTVAPGTLQPTTTAWTLYDVIDLVNPVTGVAFTQAEINALQLNLRSGS